MAHFGGSPKDSACIKVLHVVGRQVTPLAGDNPLPALKCSNSALESFYLIVRNSIPDDATAIGDQEQNWPCS